MILVIVLVALLLVIIFMFTRFKHLKHKLFWVILFIVVFMLLIGYFAVLYGKDINYNSVEGVSTATKLYLGWFANGVHNMGVLTGNAISMNWGEGDNVDSGNTQNQSVSPAPKTYSAPTTQSTTSSPTTTPTTSGPVKR